MNGQEDKKKPNTDVRCPACDYFVLQPIFVEMSGKVVMKTVCKNRKCDKKLLVTITNEQIDVDLL